MEPGGSRLADRLENLLEQLELVGREGVMPHEIIRISELREGCADILEGQLILKDVTLPGVLRLQIGPHLVPLGKQAFLNDLIHIGAGQRQAGAKPTLDLGKVVGTGSLHLTEHRIDVLLRRDDNPRPGPCRRCPVLR